MEDIYGAYVISLEKPTRLLNTIDKMGIKTNLVEGVNGKKLSKEEINNNTTFFGSLFTPLSVIGIAMAHIKVWKLFLESKAKYAIIFEDDVVFEDNFKERMDKVLKNTPDNFDMLYLGCLSCNNNINMVTVFQAYAGRLNLNTKKVNEYVNIPLIALAAHAYILTRTGAKKLIKHIKGNIYDHLDIQIQELTCNNLINTYVVNELIVYQTSTDETQSSNVSNTHPLLINNLLSNYYLEKKVKISYGSTVSLFKLGNFNFNPCSILFLIIGIILSTTNIDILTITGVYILISLPDFYINMSNNCIKIHYLLLIIPYIIFNEFNLWNKINC